MKRGILNKDGHEVLDSTPVAIPVGFRVPETLNQTVQRLVQTSVSQWAQSQGHESFEESEDFDIPDDSPDRHTPYETYFDPILGKDLTPDEFQRNAEIYKQQYLEREAKAARARDKAEALAEKEVELKKKRKGPIKSHELRLDEDDPKPRKDNGK